MTQLFEVPAILATIVIVISGATILLCPCLLGLHDWLPWVIISGRQLRLCHRCSRKIDIPEKIDGNWYMKYPYKKAR